MVGNENFSLNLQNNEDEQFNLEMQNEDTERFTMDFGEVINVGGGSSDFNELSNRPKYNSQEMTGNTNIPAVPTKVSSLENDSDYQTSSQVTSTVNSAVAIEKGDRESADSGLQSQINAKQATLTAGSNISITDNTISATDTTYTAGSGLSLTGTAFSVDTTTIATVSYVNGLVGDIETALHAINNGGSES